MALHLPPAVTIARFIGGYKAVSSYTDLQDTETNDSANVQYGPSGDLDKRKGSEKLLNQFLFSSTDTSTSRPITGHYYYSKLGATTGVHVVGAGDSLFTYSSATATTIRTGLQDNSNTFWTFTQIQDPRSAGDDIMLASNGINPIQIWNGSATAIALSSFTSATQVPIAKYLTVHKERVYALNITDAADIDSPVKVAISSFGTDGSPDPHRFKHSFYAGGSSKNSDGRGIKVLNDQIIIYTKKSVWKFTPGAGNTTAFDTSTLIEMQESIGLLAPYSLVDVGNFHIFLSERGVYAFDGNSFTHISQKVDQDLVDDSNLNQLQYAKAEFNLQRNQYILYYAPSGSVRNERALIFDLNIKAWQPPVSGRQASYISTFDDTNQIERVIYGDYLGYLYRDDVGSNDGISTGFNGSVSSATFSTLTETSAAFNTANDGLRGLMVRIYEGTGEGQERLITDNDSSTLTIESVWTQVPNTTSRYSVGSIDGNWRSKDFSFGNEDLVKIFREVRVRTREEGELSLLMHFIVDFKALAQATLRHLSLFSGGMVWGTGIWGMSRWGRTQTIFKKVSLNNTNNQRTNGTHLALRFSNARANESFKLRGFDIITKVIGRR